MPRHTCFALLALLPLACTSTVPVRYTPRMAKGPARRVAVVSRADPKSPWQEGDRHRLEACLIGALTQGRRFVVLERREIDAILKEAAFSLSAVVDERAACRAGRLLAADAIVLLQLTAVSVYVQRHEIHEYIDGHASASVKLLDVETGQIVVAAREEAQVSVIERYSTRMEAKDLLLKKLAKQIAAALQPEAAPRIIELKQGAPRLLRDGIRFAQEGLWEEAAGTWEGLLKRDPGNAAAHYNLAMARRVLGDTTAAREHLEKAAMLDPRERLYLRALAKAKQAQGD